MTDDNSFKNNPFKALEKGRFPQQKKTGAPAAPEKRGKRIARQAAVPADDEDASLFLSAMSNVERQSAHGGAARGQGAGQGGFAMEEQCAMPQVKKLKEKKKKGSATRRAEPRSLQLPELLPHLPVRRMRPPGWKLWWRPVRKMTFCWP